MKVMTIVGTRPEIIKLAEVIKEFDRVFDHILVHTGQNFDFQLNEVFFQDLNIRKPDYFLGCAGQSTIETIANVLKSTEEVLVKEKPAAVLIYGDTNSALAALAVKKYKIPLFHMEAGNRCFDDRVPEEVNRRLIDHMSDFNLPLTERGRRNLLAEGLREDSIYKTGSCMFEVLKAVRPKIDQSDVVQRLGLKEKQYFLISSHREENVDDPATLDQLIETLNQLAATHKFPILFSVHPRTKKRIALSPKKFDALVRQSEPLGFCDYVALQMKATAVLSDSGTLMEEAAILGFPAIHIRGAYERQEGMEHGTLVISPIDPTRVLEAIKLVMNSNTSKHEVVVEDYRIDHVAKTVARIVASHAKVA